MIELPEEVTVGNKEHISSLLIISRPKIGKTSNLMKLPNSLLIDLEGSSRYFTGRAIDVKKEALKQGKNPIVIIQQLQKKLREENNKLGDYKYKYGIIDTVTALENMCEPLANSRYKKSQVGQNYTGTDILADLEYGAGYRWLRTAFKDMLFPFFDLFDTIILTGHVKDSSINIHGKNLAVTDIDLTGKIKSLLAGECHANAILYVDEEDPNKRILSFKTSADDLLSGARAEHLSNQEFVLSEMVNPETKEIVTHWENIFIDDDNIV